MVRGRYVGRTWSSMGNMVKSQMQKVEVKYRMESLALPRGIPHNGQSGLTAPAIFHIDFYIFDTTHPSLITIQCLKRLSHAYNHTLKCHLTRNTVLKIMLKLTQFFGFFRKQQVRIIWWGRRNGCPRDKAVTPNQGPGRV
jgi:hypothetical protein